MATHLLLFRVDVAYEVVNVSKLLSDAPEEPHPLVSA